MKTAFALIGLTDYEPSELVGIFSNRKKAELAMALDMKKKRFDDYAIEEREIDGYQKKPRRSRKAWVRVVTVER